MEPIFGQKTNFFTDLIQKGGPVAQAAIKGAPEYSEIRGKVSFYHCREGTLVVAEIFGLPKGNICNQPVLGFHIHEGKSCSGNEKDPFSDAKSHYNPKDCPHPSHAGDMPPLFSNQGYAFSEFFTNRFQAEEMIGRTVIIHNMPDDFKSQPSGDSGKKIACGVIRRKGLL